MKALQLIISIVICQLAGVVGSIFTMSAIPTWYATLKKPSFNPPNWIFGPVWLTLYTMMGVSLFLVWQKRAVVNVWPAVIFFLIHLGINALWSVVFFGQKNISGALIIIVVLWLMIVGAIFLFWRIDRTAAYLLIPYLLWVSFASALNYGIGRLN
jgi:translocator protein